MALAPRNHRSKHPVIDRGVFITTPCGKKLLVEEIEVPPTFPNGKHRDCSEPGCKRAVAVLLGNGFGYVPFCALCKVTIKPLVTQSEIIDAAVARMK